MPKARRVYWDACTWIAVINDERAVPLKGGGTENRFAMCESIKSRAETGEFEIVTSTFTLSEVCKNPEAMSENQSKLPAFLDHPFVLPVTLDKAVGLKSQTLQVSGLAGLKPADAVHLASAQIANCEEFHTFDGPLLNLDGSVTANNGKVIKICKPGMGTPLGGLFEKDENA